MPLALSIDRFTNGLTRPFFGWVSDHLGRENTMAVAFGLEAMAMFLWLVTRDNAIGRLLMQHRPSFRLRVPLGDDEHVTIGRDHEHRPVRS